MRTTNPYIAGNPVGETPIFVGRDDIINEVMGILESRNQTGIVLYGQRRIGKTSILQKLETVLNESGEYIPVFFDLQYRASAPLDDVVAELANAIATKTGQDPPVFNKSPSIEFADLWLPQWLYLSKLKKKIVILFDEFDVLTEQADVKAGAEFFPYLSKLGKNSLKDLKFVFVLGRNIDDISVVAHQFFKGIHPKRISLLSKESVEDLVRSSEKDNSLIWEEEAIEAVWDLTHGHPYLTQALCWVIWNRLRSKNPTKPPVATSNHIYRAIPETLDLGKLSLQWLWNGLGPAEKIIASAIAQSDSRTVSEDILRKILHDSGIRIIFRELNDAPKVLEEWDIIEPAEKGYSFKVELLRQWIKENKPLTRVYEENDSIQPVANNYYQIAKTLYNDDKIDAAIQDLTRAIEAYPHHQGANMLLSDIFIQQNKFDEAKTLLEKCVDIYPNWAKPKLITVLLILNKDSNDSEQSLKIFEQILQIDKSQPDALKGKWEILRKKISVLEQAKTYDAALDIAESLKDEYPDQSEWATICHRLEQKIELPKVFKEAKKIIEIKKDKSTAIDMLLHILNLDPYFEGATSYLHLAVTGQKAPMPRRRLPQMLLDDDSGGMANWLRSTIIWLPYLLLIYGIWEYQVVVPPINSWLKTYMPLALIGVVVILCWIIGIGSGRSSLSVLTCSAPMFALSIGVVLLLTFGNFEKAILALLIAEALAIAALSIIDNPFEGVEGLDIIGFMPAILIIYLAPSLLLNVRVVEIIATWLFLGIIIGFIWGVGEGKVEALVFSGLGLIIGLVASIIPAAANFLIFQQWSVDISFWDSAAKAGILAVAYVAMVGIGFGYILTHLNDDRSASNLINLAIAPIIVSFLTWVFAFGGWNVLANL